MTSQHTHQQLTGLATRIWPNFGRLDARERRRRLADLIGIAYAVPLIGLGLAGLLRETELPVLERSWATLGVLALMLAVLDRLPFFWVEEPRPTRYARYDASLAPMVIVAALLLFGPTAVWISTLSAAIGLMWVLPRTASRANRVREIRRQVLQVAGSVALLAGAWVYELVGGQYPLAVLYWPIVWPALVAIAAMAAGVVLIYVGYVLVTGVLGLRGVDEFDTRRLGIQLLLIGAPAVFGILMATVYMQLGMVGLLFFGAAAILATLAANQLSYKNLDNSQRTREMEQLEQLGRAIISAPPDSSTLPHLLAAYVPFMFQHDQIDIVLFPDETLLHTAARSVPIDPSVWEWLAANPYARALRPNERLPWSNRPATDGMIIAPIADAESLSSIGGIAIVLPRALSDREREVETMLPAVQTLAAQIGSALQRAAVFQQVLALDRLNQELDVAASIQHSFLPERLPELPGWQFAATLRPARHTSGDFYDAFELSNGAIAVVVADVADKGTGPALFMAVVRTLLRTYAFENPSHPEVVLWAANQRILNDSHSGLFVTGFYGVIDPASGLLTYANAGHNPPLLLGENGPPQRLRNTGIPLGIEEDAVWGAEQAVISAGGALVIYTDGVTEAQNSAGEFFDLERLIGAIHAQEGQPAQAIQASILRGIDAFVDNAPQYDDQTLVVVTREV